MRKASMTGHQFRPRVPKKRGETSHSPYIGVEFLASSYLDSTPTESNHGEHAVCKDFEPKSSHPFQRGAKVSFLPETAQCTGVLPYPCDLVKYAIYADGQRPDDMSNVLIKAVAKLVIGSFLKTIHYLVSL